MLTKESKIKVLENFYALDYVFFGKPVTKMESCCPMVREEYMTIKGALMSVYIEMLKLIKHSPKAIKEKVDTQALLKQARYSAKLARENASKIVTTSKAKENIKESLKEALEENPKADLSKLVEHQIRMKAFGLAVDNLLLASTLQESKNVKQLNEWSGQILEDSYKILRDNLIESAAELLEQEEENGEEIEENVKADMAADKKADMIAIKRKCLKFKEIGQPKKYEDCMRAGKAKLAAHYEKMKKRFAESAAELLEQEEENGEEIEEMEESFAYRFGELNAGINISEAWEYWNYLTAVGSGLQASYEKCTATKCHKSAGVSGNVFSGQRRACTDLCWVKALQDGIRTLTAGKSRCKTAKNPEKCLARFDKLITKYRNKIPEYKQKAQAKMKKWQAKQAKKGK